MDKSKTILDYHFIFHILGVVHMLIKASFLRYMYVCVYCFVLIGIGILYLCLHFVAFYYSICILKTPSYIL